MVNEDVFLRRYFIAKKKLLNDSLICRDNKKLFAEFFEEQEYKLKRIRNLRKLDEGNAKTLYAYIRMLKTANRWFKNKAWKNLTKADIKNVYDGLEDGKILTALKKPYENLTDSYYSKIFKSRPFELAGKIDIARDVIRFTKPNGDGEVRFINEEEFRKIVNQAYKPHHRLLLWLAFDIGENINSLIRLKKLDFNKQINPYTKEPEYRVNLRKEILKRSRKPRSEITNYNETVEFLDQHLGSLKDDERLFNFDYRNAKKIIDRAVERSDVKCTPNGEKVTWKDLRSGMACDLLKKGYTSDEVNARLGHKPSSSEIDKYINFLAIDRHTPKKKVHQFEMQKLDEELQEVKRREKLQISRNQEMQNQMQLMQEDLKDIKNNKVFEKIFEKKLGEKRMEELMIEVLKK